MKKRYARVAYRFFYLGVYRYRYWGERVITIINYNDNNSHLKSQVKLS